MGENADYIAALRSEADAKDPAGLIELGPAAARDIADALEAADAKIAELEAQIARDAAFNEASRHYGEADLEKAVDHMQEAIKIVGQHGARRKR